jgi:hypothetical protein
VDSCPFFLVVLHNLTVPEHCGIFIFLARFHNAIQNFNHNFFHCIWSNTRSFIYAADDNATIGRALGSPGYRTERRTEDFDCGCRILVEVLVVRVGLGDRRSVLVCGSNNALTTCIF